LDVTETDTIPLLLVFGQRASIDFKSPTGPICVPAGKSAAMFLRMTELNSHKYLYKNTRLMGSEPLPDQLKTALSFVDYTVLSRFLLTKLVT
jgi:hypothetical protein